MLSFLKLFEAKKTLIGKIFKYLNVLHVLVLLVASVLSIVYYEGILFLGAMSCDAPGSCEGIGYLVPYSFWALPVILGLSLTIAIYFSHKSKYIKSIIYSVLFFTGFYLSIFLLLNFLH